LKQNDRQLVDKDANLSVETIVTDGDVTVGGDLYVLGNIHADIAITTQNEGSTLSTGVTTLNFVGDGVTASGAGAVTTVTVAGGSSPLQTVVNLTNTDQVLSPLVNEQFIISPTNITVTVTAASLAGLGLAVGQSYFTHLFAFGGGLMNFASGSGVTTVPGSNVIGVSWIIHLCFICTAPGTYSMFVF
jgi:hypothetical protein